MSIKIGNLDISSIKVGSADCKVYIGNELLYQSVFTGKFRATYASGLDYTLDCNGNTTLTTGNTKPSGYEYSAMTEAVIGDCVTSIGNNAFSNCTSLTSIDIPNSVTSIGIDAFNSCTSLTITNIPDSVTSIATGAFYNCSGLTDMVIGSGVTSIGNNVFSGLITLTSMTVNSNNTTYDSRDNCNAIIYTRTNTLLYGFKNTVIPSGVTEIGAGAFSYCTSLTSIYIPSGVTSIGSQAFRYCSSLAAIDISSGVTSIGNYAFQNCTGLTSINIPSGVTSISGNTFEYCRSLTTIDIPSGVTTIDNYAFSNCRSLTAITVNATTPPTLGSGVFNNTNNCPIYVPAASVETYKAASGWSTYASRIVAIPTPMNY